MFPILVKQKESFKVRINEHKRAVKNQDVDKNEIADHCWKMTMR